ncbi:LuxR family transcriptional regulator [Sphingopyxis sp.]|uniref:LuxR family transcriptional regulator n=1 Tax=Sphingopyxis sp. TaxID=1908224 RepID=UPI002D78F429|nr:LuxR family transcriptional regulator [Sphingopyxis sp.]HET6523524.1 LuxR family transcriptional regulator [Sphingopyxis sp.]
MQNELTERLVSDIHSAANEESLHRALTDAAARIGFDHFALSYEKRLPAIGRSAILLHDYPDAWARVYIGFELGGADPVRRAGERSMTGFEWQHIDRYIPLTRGDRQMLSVGREHGIGDGYTVPRHLPGDASGSCSFVVRPDRILPADALDVAEIVGAFALARARQISGAGFPKERPTLSERQRECVLWSARGKTAGEIAIILDISESTVIQHFRTARERYNVHSGNALILCALFDGLIGFADIFDWRDP